MPESKRRKDMRVRKKFSKRMLALLLSAVMIAEPASSTMIVHATEADTELAATEGTADAGGQEETGTPGNTEEEDKQSPSEDQGSGESNSEDQGSEENGEDQSGDQQGEGNESGSEQEGTEDQNPDDQEGTENQNPDEQNPEDQDSESQTPDDQDSDDQELEEGGEDQESEDEEVVDEEEKEPEEVDGMEVFSMPSDYELTSEQKQMKSALSASMGEFDDSAEGVRYVEKQVFAFADSREEAEAIAEAYHAELVEFDEGIAVLKLQEEISVGKALRVAASADNNLPAVYPDYYRYIYVEEQQDDSVLEIMEDEYELEENIFTTSVSEEPGIEAYMRSVEAMEEPNMAYDSEYYQWQHVNVGSVYAWGAGYKGQGVRVAVLDSGVSGNSDVVPVENINKTSEPDANDGNGHGTHVAGIIAAQLNGVGGAGIAPEAQIVNVKVMNSNGSGSDSQIMQGIRAAIGKADIMNLSLGGLGYNPAMQKVVDEAYNAGIAMFVSSGNDGGSIMCYPAACEHVICVSAIDNNNQRASFANYGAWVDLSAPGVDIWSTGNDGGFEIMSGTSQACPVAAGEAAVILSSEQLAGKSGKERVDALESLMKKNAVSAGSGMGKGVTSLTKLFKLSTAVTKPAAPVIDKPQVASDGQSVSFSIKAQAGTKIYYTDNGKAPSFKNGIEGNGTFLAESNPVTLTYTSEQALTKITISAIAVNESGMVSAVKKVTAEIKPWVTDIEISGVSRIAKGKSTQLTAEVTPSYAKNKAVEWSVEGNPSGITISAKGKVTTTSNVAPKDYTIKAIAKDRKGKADEVVRTFIVTVTEESDYIKSVKFNSKKGEVSIGNQPESYSKAVSEGNFVPVAKDAREVGVADFVWSSSNKTLATVNAQGIVTAKAPGTVKITATANDGSNKKAVYTLSIKQLATSIEIVGDDKVAAGASITLKATVNPAKASNKKVTWESSDPVNVPVKNGVVKPKAGVSGTYTITAKALAGTEDAVATKTIEVKKGKITGIVFNETPKQPIFRTNGKSNAAQSIQFTATVSGSDCALNAYSCTSSNPGIASVAATGDDGQVTITVTATGKATGKTKITLMATDGSKKKATCNVNVCNPVSKVLIAPATGNSYFVARNKSLQLKATLQSEYGIISNKNVTWELWTTNGYPNEGDVAKRVDESLAQSLGISISKTGKVSATDKAAKGVIAVKAYAADGSGASASYPIVVTEPVKKMAMWSKGIWSNKFEELTSKYVYELPLMILPFDKDDPSQGEGAYTFSVDLMCDWFVDEEGYYNYGYPAGGVSVSSSNPQVLSVQKVSDQTGAPMIRLCPGKLGSATITVKAMDGGGAQTKVKFKIVKP